MKIREHMTHILFIFVADWIMSTTQEPLWSEHNLDREAAQAVKDAQEAAAKQVEDAKKAAGNILAIMNWWEHPIIEHV